MALTNVQVKNAKAGDRPRKLFDEKGLYLLVQPTGSRWWRLKYRIEGKEKLLSLGTYPEVGLAEARRRRDELRAQRAAGIDPGAARKARRQTQGDVAVDSFEAVAREWFDRQLATWTPGHARTVRSRMERDLFPMLGRRHVGDIGARELLEALRAIEARGAIETAHRVKQIAGLVIRYGISTGRAERDPSRDLTEALTPVRVKHHAAITDPQAVGPLLRTLDGYHGSTVVRAALRLAPLVFVRPGELRKAEWRELDLDAGDWNIPAERMKMREPHLVPLARQSIAILRELQGHTGGGRFVFPCARGGDRPLSDNAVLAALRRMGVGKDEMTGHGFRAMARTLIAERLGFSGDVIEHQLAHAAPDRLGRAYNRTKFLDDRRRMMQAWADYCDELKA